MGLFLDGHRTGAIVFHNKIILYFHKFICSFTAHWNPRVSLILGKKECKITVSQILQFTMAGSMDVRLEALGLEVGAHSGADATCSKGSNDPHEGN